MMMTWLRIVCSSTRDSVDKHFKVEWVSPMASHSLVEGSNGK